MNNNYNNYSYSIYNHKFYDISLIFSPIGEVFRARIRQFPALVNCSTIDWFCPWPEAALQVCYIILFFAICDILRSIINRFHF